MGDEAARLHGLAAAYRQLQGMWNDVVEGLTALGVDPESDTIDSFIDRINASDGREFAEAFFSEPRAPKVGHSARVREFLVDMAGEHLSREIAEALGLPGQAVSSALSMLKQQGQTERLENGCWRWTGQEWSGRRYTTSRLEDNRALWDKLVGWSHDTITGSQLAALIGRDGGATSSVLRGLRRRGVIHKRGNTWVINWEVLGTFASQAYEKTTDEILAEAGLSLGQVSK